MSAIPQKHDTKKFDSQLKQIIGQLEQHGDLTFVSLKGHGKTVACQNLAQKLTENPRNKLIVFETFPKWSLEFGNAVFMEIPQNWIVESSKVVNIEKALIQHERAFTVLHGEAIRQFLNDNQHCIFLINHDDIEAISFFVYSVVYRFYRRAYDLLRKNYELKNHVYFVLEESQNSLDSKVISSKLFRRYRKLFSEARNMNLHWILITQRLQDLSTYFRARTSLAIGKIGLDDWDLKLRRLLKPIENKEQILKLERGSFYFTAINDIASFPDFKPCKPKEFQYCEPEPEKSKTLFQRIKEACTNKHEGTFDKSVYDESEDMDSELEEDLICEEEW